MTDDDRARRRARFLRELAARDLYEWFGIPPDAGDDAVREAAERKRRELASTPMPQRTRAVERAYCDQGEKALLRPAVRRSTTPSCGPRASRAPRRRAGPSRSRRSACGRLASASSATAMTTRVWRRGGDAAGGPRRPRTPGGRAGAGRGRGPSGRGTRGGAPRVEGAALRALAQAERAHALSPTPRALTTLAGARRDTGDLAGSEAAAREAAPAPGHPGERPRLGGARRHAPRSRRARRRRGRGLAADRGGRGGPARVACDGAGRLGPRRWAARPGSARRGSASTCPVRLAGLEGARQPRPQRLARRRRHRESDREDQAGMTARRAFGIARSRGRCRPSRSSPGASPRAGCLTLLQAGPRWSRSPCSRSQARRARTPGAISSTSAQKAGEWSGRTRWQTSWATTWSATASGASSSRQENDRRPVEPQLPQRLHRGSRRRRRSPPAARHRARARPRARAPPPPGGHRSTIPSRSPAGASATARRRLPGARTSGGPRRAPTAPAPRRAAPRGRRRPAAAGRPEQRLLLGDPSLRRPQEPVHLCGACRPRNGQADAGSGHPQRHAACAAATTRQGISEEPWARRLSAPARLAR